jgi:hypothetical protein
MNAWLWVWKITLGISYIIFFGVAIVVSIKGWADVRYMLTELKKGDSDQPK